ncbi:hypothetical protein B0H12DRAFT_1218807 [Mycena haematopus]|nr:hypothetical protein B0H12DRAFT_1218807 [Mycena haematopus]
MVFKRLRDDYDVEYVPPTPKRRRRRAKTELRTADDGVRMVTTAPMPVAPSRDGCTIAAGPPQAGPSSEGTTMEIRPRTEPNCLLTYTQLTCGCSSPACPNTSANTPFYCEEFLKVIEPKTTEEERQGDSFKDLDDYFRSVFQFEALPDYSYTIESGDPVVWMLVRVDREEARYTRDSKPVIWGHWECQVYSGGESLFHRDWFESSALPNYTLISFLCVFVGGLAGPALASFWGATEATAGKARRAGTERSAAKPVHKDCKGTGCETNPKQPKRKQRKRDGWVGRKIVVKYGEEHEKKKILAGTRRRK